MTATNTVIRKTVNSIIESQREEGEGRELLKDLDNLISLKRDKKLRWVWELIQNAVDCFEGDKVNISIKLTPEKVIFSHDGTSFELENLIALVRKTSTKSVEGLEGKKGKFGTGFITTHVLCSKVSVSGFLKNETGVREFSLEIDRSITGLPALLSSLKHTFEKIDEINNKPPDANPSKNYTSFEYQLDESKFLIAKDGLEELKRDLPFTLLINNKELQSVTITDENNKTISFSIESPIPINSNLSFSKITESNSTTEFGLLFSKKENELTIAFPAIKDPNGYSLGRIGNQARIFRNFPLIGTENFHSPCFIHSEGFQPSEQRDGIRTLKDDEEKPDKFADENRKVLKQYAELLNTTFTDLINNKVNNFHLFAESGIPDNSQNYLAVEWFTKEIQKPIRDFLLKHELVHTVDGNKIRIEQAKFLKGIEPDHDLYSIVSELYPSNCPDETSYEDWKSIIDQDAQSWPNGIYIGIEDVVQEISIKENITSLKVLNDKPLNWLNKLISYVLKTGRIDLIEQKSIYLSQSNQFKKRSELRIDPGFKDGFKTISKNIFRNLYNDFVSGDITNQDGVFEFDKADFFNALNKYIGALEISKASNEQVQAIFELCCYFRNDLAKKRNEWFEIINQLHPTLAREKIVTKELDNFDFESVDKWTLKYICNSIQQSITLQAFTAKYFPENENAAYNWLNRLITYVTSTNEENRDIAFKFAIVLTQDGNFRKYENNNLYRENKPADFELLFKELVKKYVGKDPQSYLIDTKILNDYLQSEGPDFLTKQVDRLFSENAIEKEVEEGGKFNALFHELNNWYGLEEVKQSPKPEMYFPIFKGKRPSLSVRAYGKEMSRIVAEKGITEITALSTLKLQSSELKKLESAAQMAGGTQVLLDKAQEIFDTAEAIRWRQAVGAAAENAFKELMGEIETKFDLENPDIGKDFTIISKETGKEFYIEIKSTVIGQDSVKMSALQGDTAYKEKQRYALCVITRPHNTIIEKDYFLENVKFVINIGELIGDKVIKMKEEISQLSQHEVGDVTVSMENKTYSVHVNKNIWESGIGFQKLIEHLNNYLLKP